MRSITYKNLAVCLLAIALVGCGKDSDEPPVQTSAEPVSAQGTGSNGSSSKSTLSSKIAGSTVKDAEHNKLGENLNLASILGDKDIPYPVYPRGSHYRLGNENGLHIIVFETTDTFEEVDAFYQAKANMPRLSAMKDYVRYSATASDQDPWDSTQPGIVIHEFSDESERQTAGAKKESLTNIIMSFR